MGRRLCLAVTFCQQSLADKRIADGGCGDTVSDVIRQGHHQIAKQERIRNGESVEIQKLPEGQRQYLDLHILPQQVGGKLRGQQVGVGAGDYRCHSHNPPGRNSPRFPSHRGAALHQKNRYIRFPGMTRSLTYLYRSFAVITANRMDSKFISTICLSPMPLQ